MRRFGFYFKRDGRLVRFGNLPNGTKWRVVHDHEQSASMRAELRRFARELYGRRPE